MLGLLNKIKSVGIITEPEPVSDTKLLNELGIEVKRTIDKKFRGSLAIRLLDAGSCNMCELEVAALNNAYYSVERFGIHFVASPRHADALMVTGPVSKHMEEALRRTWEALPEPRYLIATGTCACDGGEFGCSYACAGAVENILPVDVKIPGCPPSPTNLLRGLLSAFQEEKSVG